MVDTVIASTPDMIAEIENAGGGEAGRPDLPTGSQMEAAENALVAQREKGIPLDQVKPPTEGAPAQPAVVKTAEQIAAEAEAAKPAELPAFIPKGFDVDALAKKVEEGKEPLTADETAIWKAIELDAEQNPPPPPPEEKKYKVGEKEYSAQEFEVMMRASKEEGGTGLGDLDVSKEVLGNLLDIYHKSRNRTEFSQTTTQRAEEVAHETKKLEAARIELSQREQQVVQKELSHKTTTENLYREGARLKAELEDPLYAALTDEQSLIDDTTGQKDPVKVSRFIQKESTQRRLNAIIAELEKHTEENKVLATERANLQVSQFVQLVAPQYQTEGGDIFAVNERIDKGDTTVSQKDKVKVLELHQLLREARESRISVADVYALRKEQGTLAVKAPAVQSAGTTGKTHSSLPDLKPIPRPSEAERIRKWVGRFKGAPTPNGSGTGGTGARGADPTKSAAQQVIEADTAATRGNGSDPVFQKGGILEGYN